MKDLIEALTILSKYTDTDYPTHCEHDELTVAVDPRLVSKEDKKRLKKLGFFVNKESEDFKSFRFGSC